MLVGLARVDRRREAVVLQLRATTQTLQTLLRQRYPRIELAFTGAAAFDYDVRLASAKDVADAERRVLPVTVVILLIVFGGLLAALLPIVIGGLGVGLSLGAAAILSAYWPMTVLLENIVTMIGLGIGIDYTLLMLSRFREEMLCERQPEQAATEALRRAGPTIVLSGSAVAIGFAALLAVPAAELRSIATGGLLVVVFSVPLATLLLPGLLAWLGPRVDAGKLWRPGATRQPRREWRAWGRRVTAHPLSVLTVVGLPLVLLAWQARHISTDIPTGNWLPQGMESTRGALALQAMGRSGLLQTMRVIVEFPRGQAADSEQGWQEIIRLGRLFSEDPRVARVNSLPILLGVETAEQAAKAFITPKMRQAYISEDGRAALIDLVPAETASAGALMKLAREFRGIYGDADEGRMMVGGLPAANADYQDAIGGSVVRIVLFVVVGSFAALLIGFRSLLGAIKAVALNLLSVAAAMGLTVLVFQQGYGAQWLGVASPLDGLFPAVPMIVFSVVFGLSMDYEVFLLSRVAEGVRRGVSSNEALVDGLARTGGVITSAALVMIVVFAGFALGEFLITKILGFALAVAIVIDATLVRLALGPALIQLGGRWNWWPGIRLPRKPRALQRR